MWDAALEPSFEEAATVLEGCKGKAEDASHHCCMFKRANWTTPIGKIKGRGEEISLVEVVSALVLQSMLKAGGHHPILTTILVTEVGSWRKG